jgi:hypothetical protein
MKNGRHPLNKLSRAHTKLLRMIYLYTDGPYPQQVNLEVKQLMDRLQETEDMQRELQQVWEGS